MVRRPGDKTPDPPGGRAAERLRMFEAARRATSDSQDQQKSRDQRKRKSAKDAKRDAPVKRGEPSNEKQDRRKD